MSAVVDTNVLVFDTFSDSEFHVEARKALERLDLWLLPSIVLHEYVWALRGLKADLAFASKKVEEYLLAEKCSFSPDSEVDLLFATRGASSYAKYNDFLILSQAKRLGLPLFSFDEELNKVARRNAVRVFDHRNGPAGGSTITNARPF